MRARERSASSGRLGLGGGGASAWPPGRCRSRRWEPAVAVAVRPGLPNPIQSRSRPSSPLPAAASRRSTGEGDNEEAAAVGGDDEDGSSSMAGLNPPPQGPQPPGEGAERMRLPSIELEAKATVNPCQSSSRPPREGGGRRGAGEEDVVGSLEP
ncbi:unnamed protein product [Urochloa humidicola]